MNTRYNDKNPNFFHACQLLAHDFYSIVKKIRKTTESLKSQIYAQKTIILQSGVPEKEIIAQIQNKVNIIKSI
jgi:hypothetical protein